MYRYEESWWGDDLSPRVGVLRPHTPAQTLANAALCLQGRQMKCSAGWPGQHPGDACVCD